MRLIGAYPCGVIPLFAELYGSESLSQVHGLVVDFISSAKPQLSHIIYDDSCHLVKFCRKKERMAYSAAAKKMGELKFFVDRLHIRNHVDPW